MKIVLSFGALLLLIVQSYAVYGSYPLKLINRFNSVIIRVCESNHIPTEDLAHIIYSENCFPGAPIIQKVKTPVSALLNENPSVGITQLSVNVAYMLDCFQQGESFYITNENGEETAVNSSNFYLQDRDAREAAKDAAYRMMLTNNLEQYYIDLLQNPTNCIAISAEYIRFMHNAKIAHGEYYTNSIQVDQDWVSGQYFADESMSRKSRRRRDERNYNPNITQNITAALTSPAPAQRRRESRTSRA